MSAPERIEQARIDTGRSLRAAASAAAISEKRWRDIINGDPTLDETLAKMALAVGLTPTDLHPANPGLAELVADLAPAYEASVDMRAKIGKLARKAMPEHHYVTARDLSRAAGLAVGVARGFLDGDPWPTSPELEKLCTALGWDFQRVDGLIWSGTDPRAVTGPSLTTVEPEPGTLADHERRIARLEQALAELLSLSRGAGSAPVEGQEP